MGHTMPQVSVEWLLMTPEKKRFFQEFTHKSRRRFKGVRRWGKYVSFGCYSDRDFEG
jgi:hypothetical protein